MEKLKENVSHRKIKEPGSAITHFIAMIMAIFAATPLIIKALSAPDMIHVISLSIFIGTMILLYAQLIMQLMQHQRLTKFLKNLTTV